MQKLAPGARCDRVKPAMPGRAPWRRGARGLRWVFPTGSPLHLYEESPETRGQVEFMRAVFASGTPGFGSCAGLQVAAVAAGRGVLAARQASSDGQIGAFRGGACRGVVHDAEVQSCRALKNSGRCTLVQRPKG